MPVSHPPQGKQLTRDRIGDLRLRGALPGSPCQRLRSIMPHNYYLTHYCSQLIISTRNTPSLTCRKPLKTTPSGTQWHAQNKRKICIQCCCHPAALFLFLSPRPARLLLPCRPVPVQLLGSPTTKSTQRAYACRQQGLIPASITCSSNNSSASTNSQWHASNSVYPGIRRGEGESDDDRSHLVHLVSKTRTRNTDL